MTTWPLNIFAHGLINCTDTKTKCSHLKKLTCKVTVPILWPRGSCQQHGWCRHVERHHILFLHAHPVAQRSKEIRAINMADSCTVEGIWPARNCPHLWPSGPRRFVRITWLILTLWKVWPDPTCPPCGQEVLRDSCQRCSWFWHYGRYDLLQGVTKTCRLSWLNNSALVYKPKCGGRGGILRGSQPMSTAVHKEQK